MIYNDLHNKNFYSLQESVCLNINKHNYTCTVE